MSISNIKTVIFDMDGVLYLGNYVIPGAVEAIRHLRENGMRVAFCSNNSSKSRHEYQQKLRSMGIPCEVDEIVNSARATALYLQDKNMLPCRVLVIGGKGLEEEIKLVGAEIVPETSSEADVVVVGYDRNFTYDKMLRAHKALQGGATFIATNRDATLPLEDGEVPGGGTMVAAIETGIGRAPIVIGKPQPYSLLKLLEQVNGTPESAMMVGDRLETDIVAGNAAGMKTTLVLTGVSTREQADAAPESMRPSYTIASIAQLPELLL